MKMHTFLQKKLWRDKGINEVEQQGSRINWRRLDNIEFDQQLRVKLLEETAEVQTASSKAELVAELADVYEVIDTLCNLHQISREEVVSLQTKKRAERGGFAERMYVETAAHPEGSFSEKYCRAQPEKYPEIKTE